MRPADEHRHEHVYAHFDVQLVEFVYFDRHDHRERVERHGWPARRVGDECARPRWRSGDGNLDDDGRGRYAREPLAMATLLNGEMHGLRACNVTEAFCNMIVSEACDFAKYVEREIENPQEDDRTAKLWLAAEQFALSVWGEGEV